MSFRGNTCDGSNEIPDLGKNLVRRLANESNAASTPIHAAHVLTQHDSMGPEVRR